MKPAPILPNEAERLAALQRYDILDTAAETSFDDFTRLAAHICGTPIALISLIDADRQWFKSRLGLDATETPRDISFCGHAIHQTELFEVPNALEDERFRDNPLVAGAPDIRFYAGIPLITPDGHGIGTLCVIDRIPHQLTAEQRDALTRLGRQLIRQMEFRLALHRERELQAELAQKSARLQSILEGTHVGTWEWQVPTGEVVFNPRWAEIIGYTLEELAPLSIETWSGFAHPDDLKRSGELLARHFSGELDYYECEARMRHKDGHWVWVLDRGRVARWTDDGKPLLMSGTHQDITERKQVELTLARERARLDEAQQLARLGHWEADLVSGTLYWSPVIYEIFGQDAACFTPSVEAFHAAVHPDDRERVHASERRAAETGHHDVVHRIVRPDGSLRHVHELARMERNELGETVRLVGTVLDITELKQAEAALVAAKEAAERASQAKSEFLSSMSHELRTPMNAILGFAQILDQDDGLNPDQQDSVREILRAGWHLLDLINEVLDLAKVESGRIELNLDTVELPGLIEECFSLTNPLANQRGITQQQHAAAGQAVRADRIRLKQVLVNLLSNGIKYNRDGGQVSVSVTPGETGFWRISVRDTGRGIPAERMNELFQPFNRLGAEGGTIEGTGIGLVITRRLVEMMDGRVGVESRLGEGSTFWIELPKQATAARLDPPESSRDSQDCAIASAGPRRNVLYIEDNPSSLRLVNHLLERHRPQFALTCAHTPELGFDLARAERPELILLDLNLPGTDGFEVLQALQADAELKDVPVIALTINAMPQDIERGMAAGFAAYLTKPIDVPQLLAAIDRLMPAP